MNRSSYFVLFFLVFAQLAVFKSIKCAHELSTSIKSKPVEHADYCFGNFCIDRREFGFVLNLQHRLEQCEKDREIDLAKKYKKQLKKIESTKSDKDQDQVKINTFLKENPRFKFLREFDNFVHRI